MAEAAAGMSGSGGYREKPRSNAQNRKKGKPPTVTGWGFVFGLAGIEPLSQDFGKFLLIVSECRRLNQ